MGLEQETKDQEAKLQQAYIQLENGEAPDDQALVQWEKKMQREYRKEQDTIAKINVCNAWCMCVCVCVCVFMVF